MIRISKEQSPQGKYLSWVKNLVEVGMPGVWVKVSQK